MSTSELDRVLATANAAKVAVLEPSLGSVKREQTFPKTHLPDHFRRVPFYRRRFANSTVGGNSTLAAARALIRQAQEEANLRNQERFKNPRVNSYYANFSPEAALRARAAVIAAFTVNETVAAAAAMVAEADAAHGEPEPLPLLPEELTQIQSQFLGRESDREGPVAKRATAGFWMEDIGHVGKVPYGGPDNKGYKVFRNVKEYGAVVSTFSSSFVLTVRVKD